MGLAEQIQSAVSAGVKALDTIRKSCTYHSLGTLDYDASTDADTETGGIDYPNTMIVFTSYEKKDIDGETIHKEDKKALIPALDVSFTPKETDYIMQGTVKWEIKDINVDPADALWVFQVRKSKAD